ncbi:hypothetical protein QBC40DRAFT_275406 [Triangularia verruculosa]|uniref:Ribosomal protein bL31m N-terminal domain-containing protein n=1 Tax=Triangularia verruculosa TaxID=2587418 RepID=A0AAN6XPN1_9PEZI|nr:hypothetical protein QBC40DRAFT_275406 [Triangularia verruculosa]
MPKLPTSGLQVLRRPTTSFTSTPSITTSPLLQPQPQPHHHNLLQVRHATFIPRHRRPYKFTQLVQLSDGSTYTVRTTSPLALYKSAKDTRNHILWQPTDKTLRNVEVDEAGKLAAFRERYGRGWDAEEPEQQVEQQQQKQDAATKQQESSDDPFDSLVGLISDFAASTNNNTSGGLSAKDQAKKDKGGKKK